MFFFSYLGPLNFLLSSMNIKGTYDDKSAEYFSKSNHWCQIYFVKHPYCILRYIKIQKLYHYSIRAKLQWANFFQRPIKWWVDLQRKGQPEGRARNDKFTFQQKTLRILTNETSFANKFSHILLRISYQTKSLCSYLNWLPAYIKKCEIYRCLSQ